MWGFEQYVEMKDERDVLRHFLIASEAVIEPDNKVSILGQSTTYLIRTESLKWMRG